MWRLPQEWGQNLHAPHGATYPAQLPKSHFLHSCLNPSMKAAVCMQQHCLIRQDWLVEKSSQWPIQGMPLCLQGSAGPGMYLPGVGQTLYHTKGLQL